LLLAHGEEAPLLIGLRPVGLGDSILRIPCIAAIANLMLLLDGKHLRDQLFAFIGSLLNFLWGIMQNQVIWYCIGIVRCE
jgi:hypothetical protein